MKGTRELAFFPGIAAGPAYAGFRYQSEAGAHAARIAFRPPHPPLAANAPEETLPAMPFAPEQVAFTPPKDWLTCQDYTNGGPKFVPYMGARLDRECTQSNKSAAQHSFEVLATYPDKGNSLAAVKCGIGAGVAVLVGTHPELDVHWLTTEFDQVPAVDSALLGTRFSAPGAGLEGSVTVSDSSEAHGEDSEGSVRKQLEKTAAERWKFWIMLLQAAGLGQFLPATKRGTFSLDHMKLKLKN